ncbi:MAG TPA: hypothetical protein VGQ20_12625 [Acidimicrobiales bacterium]|nr:hypothetical protein [Acidimicrobiales bacterium]
MEFLLVALIVVVAVVAGVVVGSVMGVRRAIHGRNRVGRHGPIAPVAWLWLPRPAPRLHRRLCRCVAVAHAAVPARARSRPSGATLRELAVEIERRAAVLDRELLTVARAPANVQRRLLAETAVGVRELEALTERIVRLTRTWLGAEHALGSTIDLRDRIAALESAVRELTSTPS